MFSADNTEDLNRLLMEERQRCDALASDNESMFHLLEETRSQNLQTENKLKEKFQEDINNREKHIEQLNFQINDLHNQIQKQIDYQVRNLFLEILYFFLIIFQF